MKIRQICEFSWLTAIRTDLAALRHRRNVLMSKLGVIGFQLHELNLA